MIITQQEQARHLADLEASFVAELTALKSMATLATSAPRPLDLETHVANWIIDWREYHARNGHTPLVKAALEVALARLSVQRIAAAIWTHHQVKDDCAPESVEIVPRARVVVPTAGSKYAAQTVKVDGLPLEVPATVAEVLRRLAKGETRLALRYDTMGKLKKLLPSIAAALTPDPDAKIINTRKVYRVTCTVSCTLA